MSLPREKNPGRYLLWGLALVAVIAALAHYQDIDLHAVHSLVESMGPWGPIAWALFLWALLPFMAPVSVLTALSGLAFGPWVGFISAYVGVVGGGIISFLIAQVGGKALVERLLGSHLERLEPHLQNHGLWGVLYLRMLPLPYVPVSYLAGLTRLKFLPYAIGTAIGCIPGVLVNSVVAGTLGEAWAADEGISALFQPRTYWALGVVVFSIIGPFAIEALRRWRQPRISEATGDT